jgi:hypothetical protein
MRLVPRDWASLQHYRDRSPPWIKLHRDLMTDAAFMALPAAVRGIGVMLLLLASESRDGVIQGTVQDLSWRLRVSVEDAKSAIDSLLDVGWLLSAASASSALATCSTLSLSSPSLSDSDSPEGLRRPADVAEPVWADWIRHRKNKGAPLTPSAIAGFREAAEAAAMTLEGAIKCSITQGWTGFQAGWVKDRRAESPRNQITPFRPAMVFHEQGNPDCPCERCLVERKRRGG